MARAADGVYSRRAHYDAVITCRGADFERRRTRSCALPVILCVESLSAFIGLGNDDALNLASMSESGRVEAIIQQMGGPTHARFKKQSARLIAPRGSLDPSCSRRDLVPSL